MLDAPLRRGIPSTLAVIIEKIKSENTLITTPLTTWPLTSLLHGSYRHGHLGQWFNYLLIPSFFSPEPASLKFSKNIGYAAYVSCRLEL